MEKGPAQAMSYENTVPDLADAQLHYENLRCVRCDVLPGCRVRCLAHLGPLLLAFEVLVLDECARLLKSGNRKRASSA